MSNKIKQQLGMPFGTARNRLCKALMFQMAQKLGLASCFHCYGTIESSDDFTIEHKTPWRDTDAALFWDLNNIAFSHPKCNYSNTRRNTDARKRGWEAMGKARRLSDRPGYSWCSGCKSELPLEQFTKNKRMRQGVECYCKECRPAARKKQNKN